MTGCASAVACLGYSKTEKPSSDSADASDNKTWAHAFISVVRRGVVKVQEILGAMS